jgi:hypothetical protein
LDIGSIFPFFQRRHSRVTHVVTETQIPRSALVGNHAQQHFADAHDFITVNLSFRSRKEILPWFRFLAIVMSVFIRVHEIRLGTYSFS